MVARPWTKGPQECRCVGTRSERARPPPPDARFLRLQACAHRTDRVELWLVSDGVPRAHSDQRPQCILFVTNCKKCKYKFSFRLNGSSPSSQPQRCTKRSAGLAGTPRVTNARLARRRIGEERDITGAVGKILLGETTRERERRIDASATGGGLCQSKEHVPKREGRV